MDYEILKSCKLFEGMEEAQIVDICNIVDGKILNAEKNTYILKEGSETRYCGYLISGSAYTYQEDYSGGFRNVVSYVRPGCIFAGGASVLKMTYPLSVITREDCVYFAFDANKLLSANPSTRPLNLIQFENNFITLLSRSIYILFDKISFLTQRTTRARLIAYLIHRSAENKSKTFSIDFNRQQLADYLGVDRAAMTVVLTELMNEGYLTYNKNDFSLTDKTFEEF